MELHNLSVAHLLHLKLIHRVALIFVALARVLLLFRLWLAFLWWPTVILLPHRSVEGHRRVKAFELLWQRDDGTAVVFLEAAILRRLDDRAVFHADNSGHRMIAVMLRLLTYHHFLALVDCCPKALLLGLLSRHMIAWGSIQIWGHLRNRFDCFFVLLRYWFLDLLSNLERCLLLFGQLAKNRLRVIFCDDWRLGNYLLGCFFAPFDLLYGSKYRSVQTRPAHFFLKQVVR